MFVSQSLAAILDFGGNIEIIKIMFSSVFVYIYKKTNILTYYIELRKLITSQVMFVLRFWAAILDFCGHIKINKIAFSGQIRYIFKQRTF